MTIYVFCYVVIIILLVGICLLYGELRISLKELNKKIDSNYEDIERLNEILDSNNIKL